MNMDYDFQESGVVIEEPSSIDNHQTLAEEPARSVRATRIPYRFDDFTLNTREPLMQLQRAPSPPHPEEGNPLPLSQELRSNTTATSFETVPDQWGMYRIYHEFPSHFSNETARKDFGCDAPTFVNVQAQLAEAGPSEDTVSDASQHTASDDDLDLPPTPSAIEHVFAPFKNVSRWLLMKWWYNRSTTTSKKDLDSLVNDVILDPSFKTEDFRGFSAAKEVKLLDLPISSDDGWKQSSVEIPLPCRGVKRTSESHVKTVKIDGVWHRNLLGLIKNVYQSSQFFDLQLRGFIQMWKPSPTDPPIRVHSEAYSSDVYLELDEEVRATLPPPGEDKVENVAVMLQVYSDSTLLANFGHASLWPIYAFIVGLSKYIRTKPSVSSALHWAYIPSVCARVGYHLKFLTTKIAPK
jgi:hypothetical protein